MIGRIIKNIILLPLNIIKTVLSIIPATINSFRFLVLIVIYIVFSILSFIGRKIGIFHALAHIMETVVNKIDGSPDGSISKFDLIALAFANMRAKKSRTFVTVGGMTVGISVIVFLVSIGFGVESLVVSKVARLDEMQQTEVSTAPKSNLYLTDDTIGTIKALPNVESVLPQIAVVGKVNYHNSSTDMAVYGVTTKYLQESAISPVTGKAYDSNEIDRTYDVKKENSLATPDNSLDTKDQVLIGDWVVVSGESNTEESFNVVTVTFPAAMSPKEAVVNRAFLKVLNINEDEALDKKFSVTFIATGKILSPGQDKIVSTPTEYTIVGVTPDESTPVLYVPFIHLKSMGLKNYSQLKVRVTADQYLTKVRQLIESQGYVTVSVVDTLNQIYYMFSTLRTLLGILGAGALFVASLGMFNTLTVSLLERTREIGLLRAMGMRSAEIRDSFLSESMIMGLLGGNLGILLGFIFGKILELVLSLLAQDKGVGWVYVIELPFAFMTFIGIMSFLVGIITGIYPAKRATRISALNALRYE